MTRMRPKLVIDAIDEMFGPDRNELDSQKIGYAQAPEVRTLLTMIDEIPKELFILSPADLLEFNRCRATLALSVSHWENGFDAIKAKQVGGRDSVERIRQLLASCPDELPPEVELPFIADLDVRGGIEDLVKTACILPFL